MTKHTPGPWRVGEMYFGSVDVWSEDGQGYLVARVTGGDLPVEANARLIAAAPELLKAFIEAFGRYEGVRRLLHEYGLVSREFDAETQQIVAKWTALLARIDGEQP